ncbi:hypothetical protein CRG98_028140 [Punica granatum]|uniref:Uncharacterized protein n=1 Tax=Punica granatum TaxID=22663 RepID=A0A2I0J5D3_PUNGR|nr:hypothetical protein CRG98_028140 [Punica granatum]
MVGVAIPRAGIERIPNLRVFPIPGDGGLDSGHHPPIGKIDGKEGSRSPIGNPNPSTEVASSSLNADDLGRGLGVFDWRPYLPNRPGTSSRSSRLIRKLGPPIDNLGPFTEIAGTNRECQRPQWGVGFPSWRPEDTKRSGASTRSPRSIRGLSRQSVTSTPLSR